MRSAGIFTYMWTVNVWTDICLTMSGQSSVARSSELLTACHIDLIRYSFGEECRYVYIHLDGECLDGHLLDDE